MAKHLKQLLMLITLSMFSVLCYCDNVVLDKIEKNAFYGNDWGTLTNQSELETNRQLPLQLHINFINSTQSTRLTLKNQPSLQLWDFDKNS